MPPKKTSPRKAPTKAAATTKAPVKKAITKAAASKPAEKKAATTKAAAKKVPGKKAPAKKGLDPESEDPDPSSDKSDTPSSPGGSDTPSEGGDDLGGMPEENDAHIIQTGAHDRIDGGPFQIFRAVEYATNTGKSLASPLNPDKTRESLWVDGFRWKPGDFFMLAGKIEDKHTEEEHVLWDRHGCIWVKNLLGTVGRVRAKCLQYIRGAWGLYWISHPPERIHDEDDVPKMTVTELRTYAKHLQIPHNAKIKKADILALVNALEPPATKNLPFWRLTRKHKGTWDGREFELEEGEIVLLIETVPRVEERERAMKKASKKTQKGMTKARKGETKVSEEEPEKVRIWVVADYEGFRATVPEDIIEEAQEGGAFGLRVTRTYWHNNTIPQLSTWPRSPLPFHLEDASSSSDSDSDDDPDGKKKKKKTQKKPKNTKKTNKKRKAEDVESSGDEAPPAKKPARKGKGVKKFIKD